MHNSKVSIIIPVYNGADFMAEAIDSALAQTYTNCEIVVVNDGSTDNGVTEQIALSYGDRIRYFAKPNGGVASALNYALQQVAGDYVSWLSHDDLYLPNKIAAQMAVLAAQPDHNAVIYSDHATFTTDANDFTSVHLKGVLPAQFRYWLTVENALHGCTLLLPRRAFDTAGLFNESLRTTQDYDMWFRLARHIPFIHMPQVLVKGRSHPNQGSHAMADIVLDECNALLSGFVRGLSPAEVTASAAKPLGPAYRDIAASMVRRNFMTAAAVADTLAAQAGATPPKLVSVLIGKIRYNRQQMINTLRAALPMPVKRGLKKLLRPVPAAAATTPPLAPSLTPVTALPQSLPEKFTQIYTENVFNGRHSRSGEGSDLVQTEIIRRELPRIVKHYGITSFLDAPCGDWYWMQHTKLNVGHYIGADIVQPMIDKNQAAFGDATHRFQCLNLATDVLPQVDMIFSRDCLVHLNFADARAIIANFKNSGAKYLLTTTFTTRGHNTDFAKPTDFWRALNLQQAPFNFPAPLELINEGCTEDNGNYADKCLGLWQLADLPN